MLDVVPLSAHSIYLLDALGKSTAQSWVKSGPYYSQFSQQT